jgi:hypothetical protein
MKIAEVGVNIKSLPSKDILIEQALKAKKFYQMPRKKALELINLEIKESGLFKSTPKRVKKPTNQPTKNSRGLDNNK